MIVIRVPASNVFVECSSVCDGCWVDARTVNDVDLLRLEKDFGIASELLLDIMDVDEQPRIEQWSEYTAIIVRVPVYDLTMETVYYTVPLGILLFADKIITICSRSSNAIEDVALNRIKAFPMRNKSAFVLHILGRAALAYLRALRTLYANANLIETALQKSVHNKELIQLLSTQKSLVYITTSIKANGLVLDKMQKSPFLRLKEEEQDLLEDVITDNVQAMEMARIYSSILTGTMDAFASVISNNLNIVMKRLAIINIILMIPTGIFSFFGMNVELPFQQHVFASFIILVSSIVISLLGIVALNWSPKQRIR